MEQVQRKKQVNQGFYIPQNFFKNKGKINAFKKTKTEIIRSQTCYKNKDIRKSCKLKENTTR